MFVAPGEVLELQEADYWYGQGRVRLRVEGMERQPLGSKDTWKVTGQQIGWNGEEHPRTLWVRTSALTRHAVLHGRTAARRP